MLTLLSASTLVSIHAPRYAFFLSTAAGTWTSTTRSAAPTTWPRRSSPAVSTYHYYMRDTIVLGLVLEIECFNSLHCVTMLCGYRALLLPPPGKSYDTTAHNAWLSRSPVPAGPISCGVDASVIEDYKGGIFYDKVGLAPSRGGKLHCPLSLQPLSRSMRAKAYYPLFTIRNQPSTLPALAVFASSRQLADRRTEHRPHHQRDRLRPRCGPRHLSQRLRLLDR